MAGLPPSCLLFGENNGSLRALIKGGEGDFSPRTAGRQHASHPPLSLCVHTQTHTLQLTGTGHGLNIYQAHANMLFKKITINPCLNYMTALFSSLSFLSCKAHLKSTMPYCSALINTNYNEDSISHIYV